MSDCDDYDFGGGSWNKSRKSIQSYNNRNNTALILAQLKELNAEREKALLYGIYEHLLALIEQCPDSNVKSTALEIVKMLAPRCVLINANTFNYKHNGLWLIVAEKLNKLDKEQFVEQMLVCFDVLVWEWKDLGTLMLPIKALVKLPLSELENFVLDLIKRAEADANKRYFFREQLHSNLCAIHQEVLKVYRDSLAQSTVDRMFDYTSSLILQYQNETMIHNTIGTFVQFPLSKLNSALPQLIDSMSLNLDTDRCKWFRHEIMGRAIEEMLKVHRDLLEDKVLGQLFDYLLKLVCHNEKGIELSGIFLQFPLSKLQSSLSELICSMVDQLESEQCPKFLKHEKIIKLIDEILKVHRDSLDDKAIDQMFDYCTKLILKCEEVKNISVAFLTIPQFPLRKLETSLSELMRSMKDEMQSEQNCLWFRHQNICVVIQQVLQMQCDSLDKKVIDEMFDYCSKLVQHCDKPQLIWYVFDTVCMFTLDKLHASLPQMIDLMDCELKNEEIKWFRHQNMSKVIESILHVHRGVLNETVIEQMFQYLTKLILKCEKAELISYSFGAFGKFPLNKLESSVLKLIKLMENELKNSSEADIEWHGHNNFGRVIQRVLVVFSASLQQSVIEQMFDYLARLILKCQDVNLILFANFAFTKFPLSKLESSFPRLIRSREDELESEQCVEWFRHQNMCAVIEKVLKVHRDALQPTLIDQMFDYCRKLVRKCDNSKLISRCFWAFSKFPLRKLESSLPKMIQSLNSELKAKQSKWYLHDNISWVIEEVLKENRDSLNKVVIDQMFEYLTELIYQCENEDKIANSFGAFGALPSYKLCFSLPKTIKFMKSKLKSESSFSKLTSPMICQVKIEQSPIKWHSHNNMCATIREVLKAHRDSLPKTFIDLMFDYLVKLMRKCENGELISNLFGTFNHFPIDKLHLSLPKLMKSFKIEAQQSKWYRNDHMSRVIVEVLKERADSLDQAVVDRMFQYCTKLVRKRQVQSAIEALEVIKQKRKAK